MKRAFAALLLSLLTSSAVSLAQETSRVEFEGMVQGHLLWREGEVTLTGCASDTCHDGRSLSRYAVSAARLRVKARATDRISAQFTVDAARDPVILDAFLDAFVVNYASFRLGQFKLPFGFENYVSRYDLMTGSRSLLARHLWNNGFTSPYIRDIGLMLKGKYSLLNYEVAQVNGSGFSYSKEGSGGLVSWGMDNNDSKDYVGRLWIGVPLFAGLGFSMYEGKWANDERRDAWVIDLYFDTGKLIFQMEYERGHGVLLDGEWSDTDHLGYHVLVGYRFIPLLEGLYKYDRFDPTRKLAADTMRDYYFGVNLNFQRSARLQLSYVRRTEEPVDFGNDRFQAALAAKF